MAVIKRVVRHHGPVVEVGAEDEGLTEHPVYDGRHLRLTAVDQLLPAVQQVVPRGEGAVEVDVVAVLPPGPDVVARADPDSAVLKPVTTHIIY